MSKLPYILLVIVVLMYLIYTSQLSFLSLLLLFYIIGLLFIRYVLRSKSTETYQTYIFFLAIYGLLTLLTQIELIHDPEKDFYVHNDAAWSFYTPIMSIVADLKWKELMEGTLLNPYFIDHPLNAFLFGFLAKLGKVMGIDDIRLLLRTHVNVFAALISAMITNLQIIRGISSQKAFKRSIVFGLITYLYVTSSIFTRDLHVCFAYTMAAYFVLLPNCKLRLLKLVVICLIISGFRPVSGALSFLFIIAYYSSKHQQSKYVVLPLIMIIGFYYLKEMEFVKEGLNRVDNYVSYASDYKGGIFGMVRSLPFPINQLGMIVYMLLMPLPFSKYFYLDGGGGTFLTFPFLLSPYLMALLFTGCIWLIKNRNVMRFSDLYYMLAALFVFIITIYGSPDLRRCFAAIPGLYIVFCLYWDKIPPHSLLYCRQVMWPLIVGINLFFAFY